MRICLTNLGCKLNQAEMERTARELRAAGYQIVASPAEAELHVINSCTVTHVAARTSRRAARSGRRVNPALATVLTGCFATASPAAAAELAELVVPNPEKDRLVDRLLERFPPRPLEVLPCVGPEAADAWLESGNTRALLKVEDGCDVRCAFCIIPTTRGRHRSRPLAECVADARAFAAAGYQEVVVTGVQISAYRDGDARLFELVRALLDATAMPRLRLTSIAPWGFDARLFELWQDDRLCRHAHLSLQSGATATLKRMRRPYDAPAYAALLAELREKVPGIALTTDVIVGFPGETTADFEASLAFVADQAFAKVHVFPYSARPGTPAAAFAEHVPPRELEARMAQMLAVAEASEQSFLASRTGRIEAVLWEGSRDGLWQGTTGDHARVFTRSSLSLRNQLLPTHLAEVIAGGLRGEILAA